MYLLKSKPFGFIILALAVLGLSSCNNPSSNTGTGGSLSLYIGNAVGRTLVPALSMVPASYTVTGIGPVEDRFTMTTTGVALTANSLTFGDWVVTAQALNADGVVIGSGTAGATVQTGVTTPLSITVTPLSGFGTLDLTVQWTAADIGIPSILASLMPFSGPAVPLLFPLSGNPGVATSSNTGMVAGYSTLTLSLHDNGVNEMGAVEVVRIVNGQTTSGTYTLAVNQVGGSILVNISPQMEDPLKVELAGADTETVAPGATKALSASVSGYPGNVTYVWYINGFSVGTGATYNLVAVAWSGYHYRIDVTAFNSDGTQAGSATALQTVL